MALISISEEEFYLFNVQRNPMASVLGEEILWFKETDQNLIAVIIKDKIDNDWAYVILTNDANDEYRAIEVVASIENIREARIQLNDKITSLIKINNYQDELYQDENPLEIPKKNIIITDINEEVKKYFKKYPEKMHELTSRKFEELIASILEDMDLDVQLTKATRDGGRDIIATMKNALTSMLIFVECKKYSPDFKVDVSVIREVAGVHTFRKPEKSIIVTTSTFTKDAIEEAKLLNGKMELKDYEKLKEWLIKY
jgi:restriction endonuclease Mrr